MPVSLYRRIADDLRLSIEAGRLAPSAQLPSELELRRRYDMVSRNTIRRAIDLLVDRGLVETRAGQGSFVAANTVPFVTEVTVATGFGGGEGATYATEGQQEPAVSDPRIEIQLAASQKDVAEELGLERDEEVVSRHQLRYIGDRPWSLQTSFYPMQLVHDGAGRLLQAKNIDEGAVRYIEQTLQITEIGSRDEMTVRAPSAGEAEFFALRDEGRTAVFETRQVGFVDEPRKPLRVTVSIYATDRNRFAISTGRLARSPAPT